MSEVRLIDANALWKQMEEYDDYMGSKGAHDLNVIHRDSILFAIEQAPTVDAVPVVHCVDCKHSMKPYGMIGMVWCDHLAEVGAWVENDFYCADGKRKDGDE